MRRRMCCFGVSLFLSIVIGISLALAQEAKAPPPAKAPQPAAIERIKATRSAQEVLPPGAAPRPVIESTYGKIIAKVVNEQGKPLPGVKVSIHGMDLSAISDDKGQCTIEKVPAASPRYVVKAEKEGYLPRHVGLVNVERNEQTVVPLMLEKATPEREYLKEALWVKGAFLMEVGAREPIRQPDPNAVLDPAKYPPEVKPYLRDGKYITPSSDYVQDVAQQILSSIPPADRKRQTVVAKAVYDWIVQNITYDLVRNYGNEVTGGNWQTTYGGWGQSFNEWCYTPDEILIDKRAICIEYERLCSSLLRALGIPARSTPLFAHPVTQWWVQPAEGKGYWANMETSNGSIEAHEKGDLNARFPSRPDVEIGLVPINADAPIHVDWFTKNRCLWVEDYGQAVSFKNGENDLKAAQSALQKFAETGNVPQAQEMGALPPERGAPEAHYEIQSRGFVVELANLGDQKTIETQFPFPNGPARKGFEGKYWTNHPEWVKKEWTETISDPETKTEQKWLHVTFEVGTKST